MARKIRKKAALKSPKSGKSSAVSFLSRKRLATAFVTAIGASTVFMLGAVVGAWISEEDSHPVSVAQQSATPAVKSKPESVPLPQKPRVVVQQEPAPQPRAVEVKPEPKQSQTVSVPQYPATPLWEANALKVNVEVGKPMIAIVIDDVGVAKRRSARAIRLPAPVTLSFLTYASDIIAQTDEAKARGHELMLHVPMQPKGFNSDPGPNVLNSDLGMEENIRRLLWGLDKFDGYVGINNHMGSRFTEYHDGMSMVMAELQKRGLLFLDSVTAPKSVGRKTARQFGVPATARDIFLDNIDTVDEVMIRLRDAENLALREGSAIAIGHPRTATVEVLETWLLDAPTRGFQIVPISAVIKFRHERALQQAKVSN